jgi:DNA-binding XRE family transcriptional regulator
MCQHHYKRFYDTGSYAKEDLKRPMKTLGVGGTSIRERLQKFSKTVTGKKTKGSYCIEWTGSFSNDGYGQTEYKGKNWRIHRLAYIEAYGEIPEGKIICHHCDNRRCINPDHLYAGTQKTNAEDRVKRGRSNIKTGEEAGAAKLTEAQAIEIIRRRKSGEKEKDIAKDYNISHWTVGDIYRGKKCWRDIDRDSIQPYKEVRKDKAGRICNMTTKLTEDQVKEIKRLILSKKYSQNAIARRFNVSKKTIANIRTEKQWSHIPWPTKRKRRRRRKV